MNQWKFLHFFMTLRASIHVARVPDIVMCVYVYDLVGMSDPVFNLNRHQTIFARMKFGTML